jgi:tRNA nucleotidyltransferase (CCA-adding enzyme)
MEIILTHEQADFDALGASLGAYLMNEKAHPVLPRRMNRNVRAFLTLYGAELPFIDARDLPAGPIETVTLVDTQSLITLKGMSRKTAVNIVDHHQLRPELPEGWNITIDHTGACTTLFVEGLREHNGTLNSLHATLLLLGIHEDTGSLTYTSTTPRDVRAAAYLLEQGASLQILSRYHNPPLSDEQRQVYDRLLSTADRHSIHGQSILVARARAETLTDEISTIAHKLRDLLDPDALLLLVQTGEGIRLVARSVTDHVDVSKIAEHFGGGGHGRAAAALIRTSTETHPDSEDTRTPTLEEVHAELLRILPEHVRHSLTVRQIMSPRPLVLSPDTSVERAAQLMQRYGYEGFPVVEDGKVRGLLTRRAVDRALSHRLNLSASSLMESGEVTVYPHDPVEQLRRVMTDSGWGQVPVVDPENGMVIGIVTRTDLLKTMTDAAPIQGRQNLAPRLETALSPTRLALLKMVAAKGHEEHAAVYIVGGFVRDLLLSRPSPDFDVVVEGDAIHLGNTLSKCFGGRLIAHNRFGTAKWTINEIRDPLVEALSDGKPLAANDLPDSLDLISARTEFYDYPTALPTVERSSIKLDLHRRDFTINTMALRLDGRHYGELYDYWGGLRDLRGGMVRVLHSLSFVDDPTRMMRAVRFEQRFSFQIEERTRQLMGEAHPLMRQVSGDRMRHELNLILTEERAPAMVTRQISTQS